jgi:hypothetical protein
MVAGLTRKKMKRGFGLRIREELGVPSLVIDGELELAPVIFVLGSTG